MSREKRKRLDKAFAFVCKAATALAVITLVVLLGAVLIQGWGWLNLNFLTSFPSRFASKAGIKAALYGSVWIVTITSAFAIPVGVATAIYLQEYAGVNRWSKLLRINIANLAGMPSIVYGLIGLTLFVRTLGFDRSVLSGGLTLGLLVLPIVVIASQESIRAVPNSIREGAYALGAKRWQVVLFQVLPASIPGIMTGVILAISRSLGETAPLIIIGAVSYAAFTPENVFDSFSVLPVQIYNWSSRPKEDFHALAAAGIIVLLGFLFVLNLFAVTIRNKFQRFK